jgi:hypothetical protein
MPPHVVEMLDADAAQQGLSRTEVINAIVENYYFGSNALVGADAGYMQARKIAPLLAQGLLAEATRNLPETYEEAIELIKRRQQRG